MTADAMTTLEELARRIDRVPRARLANLPTPLEYCPNLSAKLGGPPIWMKRDDLTGLATGGNKTRYLEYVFADALKKGADTVILSSGNQSNHCRQVAAATARLGMASVLLLWGSEPSELDGNLLLNAILGAEIHHLNISSCGTAAPTSTPEHEPGFFEDSPPHDRSLMYGAIEDTKARLRRQGRQPYCINTDVPQGLAAIGYMRCALELVQQMGELDLKAAHVFVASGGTTQAGLLAAGLLLGASYEVTGVYYHASSVPGCRERIALEATRAAHLLGYELEVGPDQVDNDTRYATQPLYAGTEARWQPVLDAARTEGILLEPTYTGRAMLAVYDRLKAGLLPRDRAVVLVHSGGTPLLFPMGRYSPPRTFERTPEDSGPHGLSCST